MANLPLDEKNRLQALHQLGILDSKSDERFDKITRAALVIFDVTISTISLIDSNREWYKSCQGISLKEQDRSVSFCSHAILSAKPTIVKDTTQDPRFKNNPQVTGAPYIKFYAGVPIKSPDGVTIGVFCIKDLKPRDLTAKEIVCLTSLAHWSEAEIFIFSLTQS